MISWAGVKFYKIKFYSTDLMISNSVGPSSEIISQYHQHIYLWYICDDVQNGMTRDRARPGLGLALAHPLTWQLSGQMSSHDGTPEMWWACIKLNHLLGDPSLHYHHLQPIGLKIEMILLSSMISASSRHGQISMEHIIISLNPKWIEQI